MIVVLDTNVVISALLKENSIPHEIVQHIFFNKITLCYTYEVLLEYTTVLNRDAFSSYIPKEAIHAFLDFITYECCSVSPISYYQEVPDKSDLPFIEACLGARADFLVTGNKKHFPKSIEKTKIVSPKEFVDLLYK
jgi:uncharacterized protein